MKKEIVENIKNELNVNKYVIWIEDYDSIMVSISQDETRNESDFDLIYKHIVYYYGYVNYEIISLDEISGNEIKL